MNLSMPHPVLTPRNSNYTSGCKFDARIEKESHENIINVSVRYSLASKKLEGLVETGKAKYFLAIKCNSTWHREVYSTDKHICNFEMDVCNYEGKVTLVPYIATVTRLKSFKSDEHTSAMHDFNPNGFDLPAGSILAMADPYEITFDSNNNESIITMKSSEKVDKNRYEISFNNEYILIELHNETFNKVNSMRNQTSGGLLHPSLFLIALEYAIRKIAEDSDDSKGYRWANAITTIMDKKNLTFDTNNIESSVHKIAQTLLEDPLSRLFETSGDEHE